MNTILGKIIDLLWSMVAKAIVLFFIYSKGKQDQQSHDTEEALKKQKKVQAVTPTSDDELIKRLRDSGF